MILGGSGLIGSNFLDGLKLSSKDVNLLSYKETLECFKKYKPKIIVHAACKKLSSKLLYDKTADYFDENVRMTLNIFKAAKEIEVDEIIILSSVKPTHFTNAI